MIIISSSDLLAGVDSYSLQPNQTTNKMSSHALYGSVWKAIKPSSAFTGNKKHHVMTFSACMLDIKFKKKKATYSMKKIWL